MSNLIFPDFGNTGDTQALPLIEARHLPEDVLRARYAAYVDDLACTLGRKDFPADFPWDVEAMTVAQILQAVETHAYFFDPAGKHPRPAYDRQKVADDEQMVLDLMQASDHARAG
jgi:hypothetical protein